MQFSNQQDWRYFLYNVTNSVKHFLFSRTLFRKNSRELRGAKIKPSPIMSNVRIIEEDIANPKIQVL